MIFNVYNNQNIMHLKYMKLKSIFCLTSPGSIDKIINVAYKTDSFKTVNLSVKRKLFSFGKGGDLFWKIN